MKHKLLIVDDELPNLRLLERLFSQKYQCLSASSGVDAIRLLEQYDVAILITDQRMPGLTGIELLKQTATLRPHMVRILLTGYTDVETLVEALNSGLVYKYVTKPWNNDNLKLAVNRACEHYESNKKRNSLMLINERLTVRINEIKLGIVTALTEMLKIRDELGYQHGLRVRNCAAAIGEKMGLGLMDKEDLAAAATLHDLGQLGTPNQLSAPCGSTTAITRTHAECEARLLLAIPELGNVADIVKFRHENFDGSGGPIGLEIEQIPQASRILRVADEYDLIRRPNSPVAAMTHEEAMKSLSQGSGKQFDPKVIEILSQLSLEEREEQHPDAFDSEHSSLRQADVEPAYVDAVFS